MGKYAKAIAAAVSAFAASYAIAIQAGSPGADGVTGHEWQGIAVSTIVSGLLVWAVPNTPPTPPAN